MLKKLLCITLALAGARASAASAPPLSLSSLSTTPINVSTGTAYSGSSIYPDQDSWVTDQQTVTTYRTQLITAPTTSSPGLEYVYQDVTTSYNQHTETWKIQTLSASVSADGNQLSGGKGILLEGNISATSNTIFTLSLGAFGYFETSSGFYGVVIPALPTFYLATGSDPLSVATYGTTFTSGSAYNSGTNYYSFSLSAGQTLHFEGAVYAGNDVSLESFSLYFQSNPYDVVDHVQYHTNTVTSLYGANALPAVPEPETYAMLIAGIGVLVLRRSRRQESVKLS